MNLQFMVIYFKLMVLIHICVLIGGCGISLLKSED